MLEILRWTGLAAAMFVAPLGLSVLAVRCREPRARPLRLALRAAPLTVLLAALAILCLGLVGLKAREAPWENLRRSAVGAMFLLPLLSFAAVGELERRDESRRPKVPQEGPTLRRLLLLLAGYLLLAPVVVTALMGLGLSALVVGMRLCPGCPPLFGGT